MTPERSPPFFPEVGILSPVPHSWRWPWMCRHHVLTRLGRYFHVVWMEPPPRWRDAWIPGHRPPTEDFWSLEDDGVVVEKPPGFQILEGSRLLPKFDRFRRLDRMLERRRLTRALSALRARGTRLLVPYVWRPRDHRVLDMLDHDRSVYHIHDEYSFSDEETPVSEEEAALIRRVDRVIIHSPGLMEKKGRLNPRTRQVPNGVDFALFSEPMAEPEDLRDIPHPRIGYTGVVKRHLNFPLLISLAERHPEWSFVFVGPRAPSLRERASLVDQLEALPNVWFLGARHFSRLPAYVQHFDVCTMCYMLDGYTKYIFPLKLHEYLAAGRPVVGTPIRSLEAFRHVISLAASADQWSSAIQRALDAEAPDAVEPRREVAREYDWERLVAVIAGEICAALGGAIEERYHALVQQGEIRPARLSEHEAV